MQWEPDRTAPATPHPMPTLATAVGRGLRNRCPACGEGRVFRGYLTLVEECSRCHAPLGQLRADDAPPYFTILLVGHLLVPGVLWVEKAYEPPMWLHMAVWLPLFTILCMVVLRPVKGAVVGWMMLLGLGASAERTAPQPRPAPVSPAVTRPEP